MSPLIGTRIVSLLTLALLGASLPACAHGQGVTQKAAAACPPGHEDYGSGMVAVAVPEPLASALEREHDFVAERLSRPQIRPYATAPFAPHISLIYGLDEAHTPLFAAFLQAEPSQAALGPLCFGSLRYWDNEAQAVTSVVLDVDEGAAQSLTTLHEELQVRLGKPSRFAYHAHVTLGFVPLAARLSAEDEAQVLMALRGHCWQPEEVFWTNRCGEHVGEVHWAAGAQ